MLSRYNSPSIQFYETYQNIILISCVFKVLKRVKPTTTILLSSSNLFPNFFKSIIQIISNSLISLRLNISVAIWQIATGGNLSPSRLKKVDPKLWKDRLFILNFAIQPLYFLTEQPTV